MQNSIISEDDKKKIIEALEKKGATKECPRCSTKQFSLVDGYFNQYLQKFNPSNNHLLTFFNCFF